jgi:hypothetical protein
MASTAQPLSVPQPAPSLDHHHRPGVLVVTMLFTWIKNGKPDVSMSLYVLLQPCSDYSSLRKR